eukprot:scaffold321229_cov21-Tisochrysis_lutea.AAC.1
MHISTLLEAVLHMVLQSNLWCTMRQTSWHTFNYLLQPPVWLLHSVWELTQRYPSICVHSISVLFQNHQKPLLFTVPMHRTAPPAAGSIRAQLWCEQLFVCKALRKGRRLVALARILASCNEL